MLEIPVVHNWLLLCTLIPSCDHVVSISTNISCGGLFPCCCFDSSCPRACLVCEVCLCLSCAVSGNRFLIQQTYGKENTPCDNCILWCTCFMSWAICCAQLVGISVDPSIQNLVDCIYCTVLGCMQTQHAIEMGLVTGFENSPSKQQMI